MMKQVVIFDLFGTLVNFGIQHHPYRQLLKWARENGRKPLPNDARSIMTIDADIEDVVNAMGIYPPADLLRKVSADIQNEIESLTLFEDVIPTLDALKASGAQIAICSNLAKPYGAVIPQLLSQYSLKCILSYQCGYIKPEAEIYNKISETMCVELGQCLFVGDTFLTDVEGPLLAGMKSLHLLRAGHITSNSISSLLEIQIRSDLF